MKVQIIVNENIVMFGDISVEIDCSKFENKFVFCQIDNKSRWIEKEPFNGREDLNDWSEVESLIKNAKVKSTPPNSYSIWDEKQDWIKDEEFKNVVDEFATKSN